MKKKRISYWRVSSSLTKAARTVDARSTHDLGVSSPFGGRERSRRVFFVAQRGKRPRASGVRRSHSEKGRGGRVGDVIPPFVEGVVRRAERGSRPRREDFRILGRLPRGTTEAFAFDDEIATVTTASTRIGSHRLAPSHPSGRYSLLSIPSRTLTGVGSVRDPFYSLLLAFPRRYSFLRRVGVRIPSPSFSPRLSRLPRLPSRTRTSSIRKRVGVPVGNAVLRERNSRLV